MYNITFRIYVPTSLCTIFCLGSMYRLHNQGSEHSAVTNMYSVSNQASRSSTPTPAYPSSSTLAHRDSRDTRDTRSLINSRMSHSHTLPHSLSHHHSKFASIKGTVDYNYKYSSNYRGVGTIYKCTLNRFVLSWLSEISFSSVFKYSLFSIVVTTVIYWFMLQWTRNNGENY